MADPIRQLLSQTSYVADGVNTVWNFSFSGGYLDKSHVKAKYLDSARVEHQITVTSGMFIGEYQLNITPPVAAGYELVIYRDTPKDLPLVDFADAASLTEASLDLSAKQAVFVAAESSDLLVTTIASTSQIAIILAATEAAANRTAVSETTALAVQTDIQTNWGDKLAIAATQAGIATTGGNTATAQAVIAATEAGIATAQAVLSTTAKTAAESARDVALIGAGVYVDEPTGRAAVADGQYFKVQGSGPIAAFEYRRISAATVSTLVSMYPAVGAVSDMSLFTRTGYLNTAGVLVTDANWKTTELLPIFYLDIKAISLYGNAAVASMAYYNAAGALVSVVSAETAGGLTTNYAPPVGAFSVAMTRNAQTANDSKQWLFASIKFSNLGLLPTVATVANVDYPTSGAVSDMDRFTRSGFINLTGAITADANWLSTALMPILYLDVKAMSLLVNSAVSSIAYYDTNGAFISGISGTTGTLLTVYGTPPGTAKYVAFSRNTQVANLSKQWFYADVIVENMALPTTTSVVNMDYTRYATTAGFINTSGVLANSDANWISSGFIPVAAGDVIECYMYGNTGVNSLSFYGPDKVFSVGYSATANTLPNVQFSQSVTVPIDGYVRLSYGAGATALAAIPIPVAKSLVNFGRVSDKMREDLTANTPGIPYRSPRKLKLQPTDKVLLYGDSIMSNDYPWYATAMATLTGAVVSAGGFPGLTAAQLADDAKLQTIYDYGARLVIAMVGGNDSGAVGTVGTFDSSVAGEAVVAERSIVGNYNPSGSLFIHAVSHIMRRFKANYENIRARATLTGSETEAEKTAKIDAVLKPVLVFCTPLPQNYADSGNVRSLPASWQRKRAAVIECSRRYGVHCVDMTNMVGWNMALEPYYVGPTIKTVNNGVKLMDGIHPNKYGFQDMADIVCSDMGI